MSNEEADMIAERIAVKLEDRGCCPMGVSKPQADALKAVAEGFIVGRKTAWKTIVAILVGLLIALLGGGIIARLAELLNHR